MENSSSNARGEDDLAKQSGLGLAERSGLTSVNAAVLVVAAFGLGGCGLGMSELLIILAIVVLLFGATRLPQLGKALGQTVKGFKEASGKEEPDKIKRKEDDAVVRIDDAQVERDEPKKLEEKGDA